MGTLKKGDVIEVIQEDELRKGKSEYLYCGKGERGIVLTGPTKNRVYYVRFIDNGGAERLVGCLQHQICKIDWKKEIQDSERIEFTLETIKKFRTIKMPWWQAEKVRELVIGLFKKGDDKDGPH